MKKKITIIVSVLLATLAALVLVIFCRSADSQMHTISDWTMKQLQTYNFSKLVDKDPVREKIDDVFEGKPESADAFYEIMKKNASEMEWQVISTDKADLSATLSVQYQSLNQFLYSYAGKLANELNDRIAAGTMSFQQAGDILNVLTDEENAVLILAAEEETGTETAKSDAKILFEKRYGLYLPNGLSEELYDAVTGDIYSTIAAIPDYVAQSVVENLLNQVLRALQEYDVDTLEQMTGTDLTILRQLPESSDLGAAVADFLANCAGTITFEITDFDFSQETATVAFDYPNAAGLIKTYAGNLIKYGLTHLLSGTVMSDEISADVFRETVEEQGELPRLQSSVTLSIDSETGKVNIPDSIYDILTANLYSELGSLTELLGG